MRARAVRVATPAALAASVVLGCTTHRCDDFIALSFEVGGHETYTCALVLDAPADAAGANALEYDFAAPTTASSCDGGACTRSTCTTSPTSAQAPSFCARTLTDGHDRIAVQLESVDADALVARLGGRTFTATITCAGAVAVDHEPKSVDCIAAVGP